MVNVGLFFLGLFILFLLSRRLTRGLSLVLYHLTKREKWAVAIMAFIFLPGTIIHEVSHYVTAVVLGVHAGHMEFRPVIHGNSVKMGSVSIAKTDTIRRFLIGIAPVVWGTVAIIALMYWATTFDLFSNLPMAWGILNMTFVIGNTMYSSKRDMEGALGIFIFLAILFILIASIVYFGKVDITRFELGFVFSEQIFSVFEIGWKFLLVPIIVDIFFITLFHFILRGRY